MGKNNMQRKRATSFWIRIEFYDKYADMTCSQAYTATVLIIFLTRNFIHQIVEMRYTANCASQFVCSLRARAFDSILAFSSDLLQPQHLFSVPL